MGSRGATRSGRGDGCPDMLGEVSSKERMMPGLSPIFMYVPFWKCMFSVARFLLVLCTRRKREHELKSRRAILEGTHAAVLTFSFMPSPEPPSRRWLESRQGNLAQCKHGSKLVSSVFTHSLAGSRYM